MRKNLLAAAAAASTLALFAAVPANAGVCSAQNSKEVVYCGPKVQRTADRFDANPMPARHQTLNRHQAANEEKHEVVGKSDSEMVSGAQNCQSGAYRTIPTPRDHAGIPLACS